jgi:quercetin dioxygenase-like cupin family protein
MIRFAKLPLPFDAKLIQKELLNVEGNWQPHFNTSFYEGAWDVISLRSPGGDGKVIIPDLNGKVEYLDTLHMQHFPSVLKILSGLHCPIMAVRFLNLKAGAVIKEHSDKLLSFEKGEARLHFPVFTNPDVEFYIESGRVIMQEGQCWYINANLRHKVSNNGSTDRVHLLVDCRVNDWFESTINSSDEVSFKEEDNAELLMIIRELRIQNTDTSNKLALDLEKQLK